MKLNEWKIGEENVVTFSFVHLCPSVGKEKWKFKEKELKASSLCSTELYY